LASSLLWTACSLAGPPSAAPGASALPIELGKSFSLKAGGSATVDGGGLRVGFDAVTADSRCAKGEQCIRAGDATVRVWLQPAAGPKWVRDLRTSPAAAQAVRAGDHELRLLRLDPHPISGKALAKGDYSATLILQPAGLAEAER
jgi:hypothetical protein